MGAQDNTEKVLRSLHVLLSKSEPYPKEPSKVIVDKQQARLLRGRRSKLGHRTRTAGSLKNGKRPALIWANRSTRTGSNSRCRKAMLP